MKYNILDDIGNHFVDRAIELVKSGHKFVYVLDNIDWKEKAHDMRQLLPPLFSTGFLIKACLILVHKRISTTAMSMSWLPSMIVNGKQ